MFDSLRYKLRKLFSGTDVKLLSVGMDVSYAGACAGAARSATRLYETIQPRCDYAKLLIDGTATKGNVLSELSKICDSDLAIFTFCGHGGQQRGKQNETDGYDEFLALYDQKLLDNEVWNVVSRAKGRVFTIIDCCHSETMFCDNWRNMSDVRIAGLPSGPVDLMSWSSCGDNQSSYCSPLSGAFFTSCLVRNAAVGLTYDKMWKKVVKDKTLAKYEVPRQVILRPDSKFKGKKLFS